MSTIRFYTPNRCLETKPQAHSVLFCGQFISLTMLSSVTGLGLSYLSRIFGGSRQPSLASTKKIASGLGMSNGAFIKGLEEHQAMAVLVESSVEK